MCSKFLMVLLAWLFVQLRRIDRKLKQCRNWALDPKSEAYKAAQAQKQQQQAAQRSRKVRAACARTPVRMCEGKHGGLQLQ